MKIYFLSSRPCALTLNGAYFGVTDGFERFAEISLKDNLFVRFAPENALPVSFFLTENIRFDPPEGCDVYLLKGAIALYAHGFQPTDFSLRAVAQKRENGCVATVFQQGAVQLSLQSELGFFVATLPPSFSSCEITFESGLVLLRAPDSLAVFTKKGERLLCENVLSHETENGVLKARLLLSDSRFRFADCTYALSENACTRTGFSLVQTRTQNGETDERKLRDELLPYAFFESVLIGADHADFLAPELQLKARDIVSFLGDFVAVTPTADPCVCALIRKKKERLFEADYYSVELRDGKIADVKG
ncbi:MAG: hypothetical protein IJX91_02610 [Clostridia bacterium]|nr:hypothetical protein [Clostridia bacterium]